MKEEKHAFYIGFCTLCQHRCANSLSKIENYVNMMSKSEHFAEAKRKVQKSDERLAEAKRSKMLKTKQGTRQNTMSGVPKVRPTGRPAPFRGTPDKKPSVGRIIAL